MCCPRGSALDGVAQRSRVGLALLPVAAVVYGGWSAAGFLLPDDYFDAPAERIVIALLGLVAAVVLQRRDYPESAHWLASSVFAYIVWAHFLSLFVRAGASEIYALGLLILFAGASMLFYSLRAYLVFAIYAVIMLLATTVLITMPSARFIMLMLGLFTIAGVTSILLFIRLEIFEAYHRERMRSAWLERRALKTELETAGAQIARFRVEAQYDPLTGLANRRLFVDRLKRSCQLARGRGGSIAVLFADLDGFKSINDALGHAIGDEVLVKFAQHLAQSLRQSDFPARLAGDEFVAVLPGLRSIQDARDLCQRILSISTQPIELPGRIPFFIGVSVGVVLHDFQQDNNGPEISPEELMTQADKAMYEAKRRGNNESVCRQAALPTSDKDRPEAGHELG